MEKQIKETLQGKIKELHLLHLSSKGEGRLAGMEGERNWDNFKDDAKFKLY